MSESPGGTRDRMRLALANCTFLPASSHKRFARQVGQMHLHMITEKQWRHVIRLAWRYRRQMPLDLVPSKDAVDALDSGWSEQTVAGITVLVSDARKREPSPPKSVASLPLFERDIR